MKRSLIIFLLFVLVCLITVFAECEDATSSWMRVYTTERQPLTAYPEGTAIDPAGHLVGTDVVISPDGDIMVAAYVGDPSSPDSPAARAALGCIARDGSVVWSREYFPIEPPGSPEPEYWHFRFGGWPRLVALTHHDDFSFALAFSDVLLLLDTEGIIIHSYRFPEITHITGLLALPDGGLVLVGIGAPPLPARTPPVVHVLRLALSSEEEPETLWARRIDGLKSNWQTPHPRPDVVRTVDEDGGSYLWVGAAGGFLGCLSEDGNLLNIWRLAPKVATTIHGGHGLVRDLQYGALATDQQGRLFFGGSLGIKSRYTSATSTFVFAAGLASDPTKMSIIWARALTENTAYGLGSVVHALQATPEGLFMTGRTSQWGQDEGHYNEAAYAALLQDDGSVAWVRLLGRKKQSEMKTEYSNDLGHAIVSTGDGGAVLVGGTSSFSHPEPWRQPVKETMTEHPELLVVSLGSGGEVGNIGFGRYPDLGLAPELGDRSRQVDVLTPELTIEEANMSVEEITVAAEAVTFGTREGGWEERYLHGQRNPGDRPPTAVIHLPIKEDDFWENFVWLDGSASSDPEGGYIVRYQWDFGDGKTYTSTSPEVSHKYPNGGKYEVTLTVTDEQGFSASKSIPIVVGQTLSYKGKGDTGIPAALIDPNDPLVNYQIEITTGDVSDAGTDSWIYLSLFGPEKENGRYGSGELNPYNALDALGPFEKGNTDSFINQGYNLDEVEFMTLRHNNHYDKPGWYVKAIKVKNTYNGKEWLFVPDQWLAMDKPPEHQTWGKFYPVEPYQYGIFFKGDIPAKGINRITDNIFILYNSIDSFYFTCLDKSKEMEVYKKLAQDVNINISPNGILIGRQEARGEGLCNPDYLAERDFGVQFEASNLSQPTQFLVRIKDENGNWEEKTIWIFPAGWQDYQRTARQVTLLYPLKGNNELFEYGQNASDYLEGTQIKPNLQPIIDYGIAALGIFGDIPDNTFRGELENSVKRIMKEGVTKPIAVKILTKLTGKAASAVISEAYSIITTLHKAIKWAEQIYSVTNKLIGDTLADDMYRQKQLILKIQIIFFHL
jgi:PKD repeat protein